MEASATSVSSSTAENSQRARQRGLRTPSFFGAEGVKEESRTLLASQHKAPTQRASSSELVSVPGARGGAQREGAQSALRLVDRLYGAVRRPVRASKPLGAARGSLKACRAPRSIDGAPSRGGSCLERSLHSIAPTTRPSGLAEVRPRRRLSGERRRGLASARRPRLFGVEACYRQRDE